VRTVVTAALFAKSFLRQPILIEPAVAGEIETAVTGEAVAVEYGAAKYRKLAHYVAQTLDMFLLCFYTSGGYAWVLPGEV